MTAGTEVARDNAWENHNFEKERVDSNTQWDRCAEFLFTKCQNIPNVNIKMDARHA